MFKWLLTVGIVALFFWIWQAKHQRNKISRKKEEPVQLKQGAALFSCHQCGVLLPPELTVQKNGQHFCQEHAPRD